MKLLVTGATGFTGSCVVPLLIQNGFNVRCLSRSTSDRTPLSALTVEWVTDDLSNAESLTSAMQGTDALVNIASLGFGHADNIISAAKAAGIKRAIFISTTAIFTQLNAGSKSVRLAAEDTIRSSGLDFTILRPTMIYGSPRDRNMWRLIRLLRISPVMPIFGDGGSLQQPIFVDDVAQAVLRALQTDATIGKSYNIAGKAPLTSNPVIDTVAASLGKRIWKRMHIRLPIKAEQVLRLNENKDFSYAEAQRDFGFSPCSFGEGIKAEVLNLTMDIV